MIGFLTVALVLIAAASLWIFVPLFKSRVHKKNGALEHDQANLRVLRAQWEELENDHRLGVIGDAELAEAKAELERRTLEEAALQEQTSKMQETPPKKPALIWGVTGSLAVLCVAGVLYFMIGTPAAFDPRVAGMEAMEESPHDFSPAEMEEMLNAFAARLENEPDNIEGRMMLARSYVQTGRFMQAAATYERLLEHVPDNVHVLSDYADLLAMMQGGRLEGRPMALIERALEVDPTHWKALGLAGTYAFDTQDYAQAVVYWSRMKATVPGGSEIARSIDGSIAEARARAESAAAASSGE